MGYRRDGPFGSKYIRRQTVVLEPSSPSKKKKQSVQLTAGGGRQLLPKYTKSLVFSCGSCRGLAPEQLSLKYQLEFNLLFKRWFKAFGHQGQKGPKLHLHGSWPANVFSGHFQYCQWPPGAYLLLQLELFLKNSRQPTSYPTAQE